ncbi:cytochrome P450, partial [Klebsiella pneumoniae]
RYAIRKDQRVVTVLLALHRDPAVWDRPEVFDIDRFLPENEAKLHPHAYKPFGNGERACIGRQFALTEAKLALAVILQRFALSDPYDYDFHIKETLTLKPDGFRLRARLRNARERLSIAAPSRAEATTQVDA